MRRISTYIESHLWYLDNPQIPFLFHPTRVPIGKSQPGAESLHFPPQSSLSLSRAGAWRIQKPLMSVRPSSSQENPSLSDPRTREWETKARTWLSSMPSNHVVSTDEMDGWIDSDLPSFPEDLKSLPRSHLHRRILSLLDLIRRSSNQVPRYCYLPLPDCALDKS